MSTIGIDAMAPKKVKVDVDSKPPSTKPRREFEVKQQPDGEWYWHGVDTSNRKITVRGQSHDAPSKCERAIRQELKAMGSTIEPVIKVFPPLPESERHGKEPEVKSNGSARKAKHIVPKPADVRRAQAGAGPSKVKRAATSK